MVNYFFLTVKSIWELANGLKKIPPDFFIPNLAATLCAWFDNSNDDYFGALDGDLEDPPEIAHDMMDHLKDYKFGVNIAERISAKINIFRKLHLRLLILLY